MTATHAPPPTAEFIALMAALVAMVAMSIDAMLPALGSIATELGAGGENSRQLVITLFFLGFAGGQLIYGPLSDSFGRKPIVFAGIAVYLAGTLICALATDFTTMLVGRALQGFGAASPRIVSLAMVRDSAEGAAMARVNSFIMAIFIAVPIIAPALGQIAISLSHWRMIFAAFAVMAVCVSLWLLLRQPETLPLAARSRFSAATIARGFKEVLTSRAALGYAVASGFVFASLIAYLGMSQQIFAELYGMGAWFPAFFAVLAAAIGISSLANAGLVMRLGMLNLSRWAIRVAFAASLVLLALAAFAGGRPALALFFAPMLVIFFCNGLLFGNLTALSMQPMGHIAGIASAVIGMVSTLVALALGGLVGQYYNQSVIPLAIGFALFSLAAVAVIEWTERA